MGRKGVVDSPSIVDRLREFLSQLEGGDPEAFTTTELCRALDVSLPVVRAALTDLISRGEVIAVKKRVLCNDGKRMRVSAYKFVGRGLK